jgi:hypothetical protein
MLHVRHLIAIRATGNTSRNNVRKLCELNLSRNLKIWPVANQKYHTEAASTGRVGDEVSILAAKGAHCRKL